MRLPLRKRFNANLQGNIQAFMLKYSVKADDVQLLCDTEGNLSKQTHARRNYLTVYGTVLFTVFASVWMTHIIRQSQQALTESLCKGCIFVAVPDLLYSPHRHLSHQRHTSAPSASAHKQ